MPTLKALNFPATRVSVALAALGLAAGLCRGADAAWNNPYPSSSALANSLYSSFSERPKHLDPARSYSSDEYAFIGQIYEPPLQYHYLLRPYTLVPLSAAALPRVQRIGDAGELLDENADPRRVAYTVYEFRIREGIRYQPHPAFARDADGSFLYHALGPDAIADLHRLGDLPRAGTREVTAADFVYQVKRLADPAVHSPIAGLMKQYITGLGELAAAIAEHRAEQGGSGQGNDYVDLREFELPGATVVDRYTYRIRIEGSYPQFIYWQAMPFFAPMPWEADRFYAQPGLARKNVSLDWYPVGTGPFMLAENNPNLRMVLRRNPNFHGERYPTRGEPGDARRGLLRDSGRPLPFVDEAVYSLEKESIPRWNKFLQGYYDDSGLVSDSFDQAIRFGAEGEATLTEAMRERGIELSTAVATTVFYMGFNMLDPVVGGLGERGRLLRRAIAIAVDFEEFVSIFRNGRGVAAQGPLPPGIFGHREGEAGINTYVYDWVDGAPRRKPLAEARALMRRAGYAEGHEISTGEPLVLHFEAISRGPDDKARFDWYRKQFAKLDIQLVVRATDYNRFRDKMLKGTGQIYLWGWNADYPDPENFLFLLYGPNSKARHNGENTSNYANPEFDRLFERMKAMANTEERQAIIDQMLAIVRRDAPWLGGFHPRIFQLRHGWYHNAKPNLMANNTLKYARIDPAERHRKRQRWNQPVLWPLALITGLLAGVVLPAVWTYRRRQKATAL